METHRDSKIKKGSKGKLLLFMVFIVIVLAFIVRLRFLQKTSNYQRTSSTDYALPSNEPTQIILSPTIMPYDVLDETANWKVYDNKDLGYSIKIPPTYSVDDRFYPNIFFRDLNSSDRPADPGLGGFDLGKILPEVNCINNEECVHIIETSYKGAQNAGSAMGYQIIMSTISGNNVKGLEEWTPAISENEGTTRIASSLSYLYPLSVNGNLFEVRFQINGFATKSQAVREKILVDKILSTINFYK